MPARLAPRFEITGKPIAKGDWAMVTINGRAVAGVVKHASTRSRKIEVWVPPSAVAKGQARRRSVCRRDVTPAPWLKSKVWPRKEEGSR